MSYDKDIILGHAKNIIKNMKVGTKFTTFDIFSGFDYYDNLAKKDKMAVGVLVRNEVEMNNIKNVSLTGLKRGNRVLYLKDK